MSKKYEFLILILTSSRLLFNCSPHAEKEVYISKEATVDITYPLEELSPFIDGYGVNFYYDKGFFSLSIPMVGNFYQLDSSGTITSKIEYYTKDEIINSNQLARGSFVGSNVIREVYYSYLFKIKHYIKTFDPKNKSTETITLKTEGTILYGDFIINQDKIYHIRSGRNNGTKLYEIHNSMDKNSGGDPILSKSITKHTTEYTPYFISSNKNKFYLLKQYSDSIEVYSSQGKFEKHISLKRSSLRDYDVKEMPHDAHKLPYSEMKRFKNDKIVQLKVYNDTIYIVHRTLRHKNISKKILTIQSGEYFLEKYLNTTFIKLGDNRNYISLEKSDKKTLLHSNSLQKLISN